MKGLGNVYDSYDKDLQYNLIDCKFTSVVYPSMSCNIVKNGV